MRISKHIGDIAMFTSCRSLYVFIFTQDIWLSHRVNSPLAIVIYFIYLVLWCEFRRLKIPNFYFYPKFYYRKHSPRSGNLVTVQIFRSLIPAVYELNLNIAAYSKTNIYTYYGSRYVQFLRGWAKLFDQLIRMERNPGNIVQTDFKIFE